MKLHVKMRASFALQDGLERELYSIHTDEQLSIQEKNLGSTKKKHIRKTLL